MTLRTRYPDLFHGHGRSRNFFEGWYFKLVDPGQEQVFAFIPGLFLGNSPQASHSFAQFVHGSQAYFRYLRYPAGAFQAARDSFDVGVGESRFSLEGIDVNLRDDRVSVQGQVQFKKVETWPDTLLNPGSMGFYNYIPRMQCYSQVCALDMELQGKLEINGKEIDFTGGRGYVEKNWGSAFPYSWIWVQSNNFSHGPASLTCSLAHIPFLFTSFRGFLIGFSLEGRFYPFTTMNRSRCWIQRKGRDVFIEVSNKTHTLTMETWTDLDKFILLHGPRDGRMVPLVQENLLGRVQVFLKEGGKTLFSGEGTCAGIEYGGQQMMVLDQQGQVETDSENLPFGRMTGKKVEVK